MSDLRTLTLLHSNDLHGDFLAEFANETLVGGVSMLSGYVNKVRNEEANVIYAIAGDMFRGSIIDSEYKGLSTIELMNLIGPDVVTIGNHEVDYGLPHLLFIEKCAKFPIINANFFITSNHTRLFQAYKILKVGGMKVLFIGILTEETLAATKSDGIIGTLVDIEDAARAVGRICNSCKTTDVDFTVLLTHIGWEEDQKLAELLDPNWGVDIIIGGHSHTLPEEPITVNGAVIVQAGTGTDQIGRFDIVVDVEKNCIDSYTWQIVPINEEHCPHDTYLEELLQSYKGATDEKYGRIITKLKRKLTHPSRTQETEVGDLFADMLQESLGVDIMILGSGSLRLEEFLPVVHYNNLLEMFPYDGPVYMLKVTGAQLRRMVMHILREDNLTGHGEFYQFSKGMRIVYDRPAQTLEELSLNGAPIQDDALYSIGLQDYHFKNMAEFLAVPLEEAEENGKARTLSTNCNDIFEEYLGSHPRLNRKVEGRLVVKE